MSETTGTKKHPPTPNRLWQLRRNAQWYSSKELTGGAVFLTLAVLWTAALPAFGDRAIHMARLVWEPERLASPDPLHEMAAALRESANTAGLMLAIAMAALFCAGILTQFLQVGVMFSARRLLQMSQLNPGVNLKRIFFSPRTYQRLAMGFVKALLMLALVSLSVWGALPNLMRSMRLGSLAVVKVFNNRFTVFLWEAGALYLLLGAADYLIEKRDFQKQNRMTDEELREDVKQIEGNIESRMRLRHLGYAISMTPRPKPQPPQPAGVSRSLFDFLNPKK